MSLILLFKKKTFYYTCIKLSVFNSTIVTTKCKKKNNNKKHEMCNLGKYVKKALVIRKLYV